MLAALGGMIAPAIVFLSFNAGTPVSYTHLMETELVSTICPIRISSPIVRMEAFIAFAVLVRRCGRRDEIGRAHV